MDRKYGMQRWRVHIRFHQRGNVSRGHAKNPEGPWTRDLAFQVEKPLLVWEGGVERWHWSDRHS